MSQSENNYSKYKEKIQNGESKAVRERLSISPDREFKVMFESVTGKVLPEHANRSQQIEEIITALSS